MKLESKEAKHTVIEVNKNQNNHNSSYKTRYVQDIEILTVIREYHYYPDNSGSYNIPKEQNNIVTYGSNVKVASMLLVHRVTSSMDQTSYVSSVFFLTQFNSIWYNTVSLILRKFNQM